jgi:hypothetical protein
MTTMGSITQEYSPLHQDNQANVQDCRAELPEFPLWWLAQTKRNMEGLREIASHLHGKTAAGRSSRAGFFGETSEMDKQIIRNVSDLEQQVYVLTDVLQSVIQIVVEEKERRISQRIKKVVARSWSKTKIYGHRFWDNPVFKICGGLSTIAFVVTAIFWIIRTLGK